MIILGEPVVFNSSSACTGPGAADIWHRHRGASALGVDFSYHKIRTDN
jgi:hypothetical protein